MAILRLIGWEPGMIGAQAIRTLRDHAGLGLSEALGAINSLLDDGYAEVAITDRETAMRVAEVLRSKGVTVDIDPSGLEGGRDDTFGSGGT